MEGNKRHSLSYNRDPRMLKVQGLLDVCRRKTSCREYSQPQREAKCSDGLQNSRVTSIKGHWSQDIPLKSLDAGCRAVVITAFSDGLQLCFGLIFLCYSTDLLSEMGMCSMCLYIMEVYRSYFVLTGVSQLRVCLESQKSLHI